MYTLIEKRHIEREYGFHGVMAIIENGDKRYLIQDGFGGIDSVAGGCVRWIHGSAYELQSTDTIDFLFLSFSLSFSTVYTQMIAGYDDTRPHIDIGGSEIEKIAETLGL